MTVKFLLERNNKNDLIEFLNSFKTSVFNIIQETTKKKFFKSFEKQSKIITGALEIHENKELFSPLLCKARIGLEDKFKRRFSSMSKIEFRDYVFKEIFINDKLIDSYDNPTNSGNFSVVLSKNDFKVKINFVNIAYNWCFYVSSEAVLKEKLFYFLSPLFKKSKTALKENLIFEIIQSWNDTGVIPSYLDTDLKVKTDKNRYGLFKISDGTIFFIPKFDEELSNTKQKYINSLLKSKKPANRIISFDTFKGVLVYSNSSGNIEVFDFRQSSKVIDTDIIRTFNKPLDEFCELLGFNIKELNPTLKMQFTKYEHYNGIENISFLQPISFYFKDKRVSRILLDIIRHRKNLLKTKLKSCQITPINYLIRIAYIQIVLENYKKFDKLKYIHEKRRALFDSNVITKLPEIPNLRTDLFYLKHQGTCISKLDIAGELAIIDVSTGGGKTLIMICDILNLLNRGRIKRAIIIVPNNLVWQIVGEINYFTGCSVNAIPITTETVKNWGKKRIASLCKKAPINSIFISTYNFISNRNKNDIDEYGNLFFPNLEFLKEAINPEYCCLDESHFIKNSDSQRSIASRDFISIPYRRLSTGTLIPHTPLDLVGQIGFLDPNAMGTLKEFGNKYGLGYVNQNGKHEDWKPDAKDKIREDLNLSTYYLNFREKHWAASLPKIEHSHRFVKMRPVQEKIYRALVYQLMVEISADPILSVEWNRFCSSTGEDEALTIPAPLLGKLATLEQYLTAPTKNQFIEFVAGNTDISTVSKKDKISPKLKVIDDLIEESINLGEGKVIVACHYKISAAHLKKYSRYSDVSVYYDAGHKQNLTKFINDPKIKVAFAVILSLTEGVNLQICDRIICPDVDWSAGKLKQLIARSFRPYLDKITLNNLNLNKTVHINHVFCDNSADILKYCYQVYNKLFNAQVMENSPIDKPERPVICEEYLSADSSVIGLFKYLQKDMEYINHLQKEIEEAKLKDDFTPIKPIIAKQLAGSKMVKVPWVENMPIPESINGTFITNWIRDKNFSNKSFSCYRKSLSSNDKIKFDSYTYDDLRKYSGFLIGRKVVTEFGTGKIIGVNQNSSRINFGKFKKTIKADKVALLKKTIKLNYSTLNEYHALTTNTAHPELFNIGFKQINGFYYVKIESIEHCRYIIRSLKSRYKVAKHQLQLIKEVVIDINNGVHEGDLPDDLEMFYQISHNNLSNGLMNIYPLIKDDAVYLMINNSLNCNNKFLSKLGFKFKDNFKIFYTKDEKYFEHVCSTILNSDLNIADNAKLKQILN